MKICYNKLWKLLIDKKLKKTELKRIAGISSGSLAKLGKDENVSLEVLQKICIALQCDIGDIMEDKEGYNLDEDASEEECWEAYYEQRENWLNYWVKEALGPNDIDEDYQ